MTLVHGVLRNELDPHAYLEGVLTPLLEGETDGASRIRKMSVLTAKAKKSAAIARTASNATEPSAAPHAAAKSSYRRAACLSISRVDQRSKSRTVSLLRAPLRSDCEKQG